MKGRGLWDETFLECTMEEVEDLIQDAVKSRRKHFEQSITVMAMGRRVETITITVKRERS